MGEELARTDAGEPLATGLVEQTEDQLQRPLKGYQVRQVPLQVASCRHGAHPHRDTPHGMVTHNLCYLAVVESARRCLPASCLSCFG